MKVIQGFVSRAAWTLNTPGAVSADDVSVVFELSPIAKTYGRSVGEFHVTNAAGEIVHVFINRDQDTEAVFEPSAAIISEISDVVRLTESYLATAIPPYNENELRLFVQAEMNNQIHSLTVGEIERYAPEDHPPGTTIPTWISWQSLRDDGYLIKVWLHTRSFEAQYSAGEILTTSPVVPLDSFFNNYQEVVDSFKNRPLTEYMARINADRGDQPETQLEFLRVNFVNRLNPSQKTPIDWAALIYGRSMNDIDSIKEAIVRDVLRQTQKTEQEWRQIFPELFERTEFLIFPRWDLLSHENATPEASLFKSILNVQAQTQYLKSKLPYMDPEDIDQKAEIFPVDYKAAMCVVVPGIANAPGIQNLDSQFPDYLPVNTSSVDFGRMSQKTRDWVLRLVEMLAEAEVMTTYSTVPYGYRRYEYEGIMYLSTTYEGVNYRVASRYSTT